MDADRERINSVTQMIVGRAFTVENALGNGFAERVYENALAHELRKHGLYVEQQKAINVYYDGVLVGEYVADLIVQDVVLVELKAVRTLDEAHRAQCLNYLKATGIKVGLLLNFGAPRVEVKRLINQF